ncbi:uncharacterized protein O3C94_016466 [Discoglossus pictus]
MKTKNKKMSERILNHILEILILLTGEVSVSQRLTTSLTVLEMTKDTQRIKGILKHSLEIISLLTGEEYTIVKKTSSNIHLSGEVSTAGQCDIIPGHSDSIY